ncbi:MAG: hypothetical protein K0R39_3428 [Symbiobacteriaceae bacterium]|jgi:hypothetical protein|nr:hypothetical protein [Symbiobacteriaceae bacterium]
MMMMPPRANILGNRFFGRGWIDCEGSSNEGFVFCLLDPDSGSRLADLVVPPMRQNEIQILTAVARRQIETGVSGTILSTPSAIRPRVEVETVSTAFMMNPAINPMAALAQMAQGPTVVVERPTPRPQPAPRPAPESYGDCVLRCIASKVPGITVEELLNLPCNIGLLAMGALPAVTGPQAVATLPAAVVALASCVAATFGLTVGAILECFIACAPGGRLTPEFLEDDDDDNGSGGDRARMEMMTSMAAAVYREAARRGVRLTQAQVADIVRRHCPPARPVAPARCNCRR